MADANDPPGGDEDGDAPIPQPDRDEDGDAVQHLEPVESDDDGSDEAGDEEPAAVEEAIENDERVPDGGERGRPRLL